MNKSLASLFSGLLISVFLAAGGSGPMPASPAAPSPSLFFDAPLTIAAIPQGIPPYMRADWHAWIDADGDCQDTRAEVLIERSIDPVVFRDSRHCVVSS